MLLSLKKKERGSMSLQPSYRHSHWWSSVSDGDFDPDPAYPSCPHPGQVVTHYRCLSGLTRQQVSFRLSVGAKEMYYLEAQCRGLDDMTRRRLLCTLLSIPPELLGLAQAPVAVGGVGWWVKEYQAWPAESGEGAQWPDPGEVTRYYRRLKGWTQAQLAEALGLTELSVRNMEKQHAGLGMVSRRRALAFLLSIPPLLLGLDAEHSAQFIDVFAPAARVAVPAVELMSVYRSAANSLLSGYILSHEQDRVANTLSWLSHAREISSMLHGAQRAEMYEVQSLGYQGLVTVTKAFAPDSQVFCYANQSVSLARSAKHPDVLAIALQRRSEMLLDRGHVDLAQRSAREALLSDVSDPALAVSRAAACARVLAATATDREDRFLILGLLEKSQPQSSSADDPFSLHHDREILTIRIGQTFNLLAVNAPESESKGLLRKSRDLLEVLSPASARSMVLVKLELAKAFAGLGEFDAAAILAGEALPLMDQLRSVLYLRCLSEVYSQVRKSSLRDSPQVARLGLYLHEHTPAL